jgi:hypothetical protein
VNVQWNDCNDKTNYIFNRQSFFIENGSHRSELSASTPSNSAAKISQGVLETFTKWTNCDCTSDSEGFCEYGSCVCISQSGGKDYMIRQIDSLMLRTAAAVFQSLPARVMIVIGFSAWFWFLQEVTEQKEL